VAGSSQILSGSGSPNGVVTAPKGSLWLRTDGTTTNNRAYINTNAGTTWTALTTIA
jgi:secreted PhoX family phosphatase